MVIWNDDPYLGTWKVAASICQFTALGSARRPCHRPATEQVRVHVPDGLTSLPPGVEHDPVAAVLDSHGHGDLVRMSDKFSQQTVTSAGQGRYVRVVVARDHQHVRGGLRVDVTEGDYPLSVQHDRGRDRSGRDTAEQTVWHTSIIVAQRHRPVRDLGPRIRRAACLTASGEGGGAPGIAGRARPPPTIVPPRLSGIGFTRGYALIIRQHAALSGGTPPRPPGITARSPQVLSSANCHGYSCPSAILRRLLGWSYRMWVGVGRIVTDRHRASRAPAQKRHSRGR